MRLFLMIASALVGGWSMGIVAPLAERWTVLLSVPSLLLSSVFFWSRRHDRIWYWVAGWWLGAVLTFMWIPRATAISHGETLVGAWCKYILAALCCALVKCGYAHLVLRAHTWFSGWRQATLWGIGCVWSLECLWIAIFPWYEPVGVVYCAGGLEAVQVSLAIFGYEMTALLCITLIAFGVVSRRILLLVLVTLVLLEIVLPLRMDQTSTDGQVTLTLHQRVHFEPRVVNYSAADVDVWPESACVGACPEQISQFRIAGRQRIVRLHSVTNEVVVMNDDGREFFSRNKIRPAPGEATRLAISGVHEERAAVLGEIAVVLPICYEILDRAIVGCCDYNLGITVSSDVYDTSGMASEYLSGAAKLRAIEANVPFVRVSNTSNSAVFSGDGQLQVRLPRGAIDETVTVRYSKDLNGFRPFPVWVMLLLHAGILGIGCTAACYRRCLRARAPGAPTTTADTHGLAARQISPRD